MKNWPSGQFGPFLDRLVGQIMKSGMGGGNILYSISSTPSILSLVWIILLTDSCNVSCGVISLR